MKRINPCVKQSILSSPQMLTIPPQNLSKSDMISNNNKEEFEEQKESDFICEFCKKCFSKKYNLERHIKNVCGKIIEKEKVKDINNEGIKKQIEILVKQSVEDKINKEIKKELDMLKKENEKLKKQLT